MNISTTLSKNDQYLTFWLLLLAIFGFFYKLDISPMFLEEPRRGLIALEMIINDNYWVPTLFGDYYYRKPPVFNWMVLASFKLFGFEEIAARFVAVISHLLLSVLIFLFVRPRINAKIALYAAFSYMLAPEFLSYASLLGEIDLFYALITASAIMAIFHFGDKQQDWSLFIVVYALTAIGFLTKGITSLPFTGISLLVYFIYHQKFKVLFGIKHLVGIMVFITILSAYFWQYAQYAPVDEWFTTLYSESVDKATDGGFWDLILHVLKFPFVALAIVFPATLLLLLWVPKRRYLFIKKKSFASLCLLIFGFNFVIYWFSIGAENRYIYPILPFLTIALVSVFTKASDQDKALKIASRIFLGLAYIILIAAFFISELDSIENLNTLLSLCLVVLIVLTFFHLKGYIGAYWMPLFLLALLKICFSGTYSVVRSIESSSAADKILALEIAELTRGEDIYRYNDQRIGLNTGFYLTRDKMNPIRSDNGLKERYYFINEKSLPTDGQYQVLKELKFEGNKIYLIEMLGIDD